MTKQEKMRRKKKYEKRQTILLIVIGVILAAAIIVVSVILLTSGNKNISQDTLGSQSQSVHSDTADTTEAVQAGGEEGADLKDINFKSESIKLHVGEKVTPELTGGKISDLENWNSNDVSVVTVDDKGQLTGVSKGSAQITASVKNGYSLLKISVDVVEGEAEPAEDDTEMEDAVVTGTTDKGYKIYEKDGCTYIDGILMASKTFTLPEDYAPGWEPVAEEAFNRLSDDAAKEGLDIYASSTFRSYEDQDRIYNNYVSRDGQEAADTYSSRPGHSDHQTGLAIDVNTIDDAFGYTAESDWLAAHAHEYGFIIRYPEGKADITGYQYEPWHIRYIGVEKATEVYESGLSLEEFLGVDSKYDE